MVAGVNFRGLQNQTGEVGVAQEQVSHQESSLGNPLGGGDIEIPTDPAAAAQLGRHALPGHAQAFQLPTTHTYAQGPTEELVGTTSVPIKEVMDLVVSQSPADNHFLSNGLGFSGLLPPSWPFLVAHL